MASSSAWACQDARTSTQVVYLLKDAPAFARAILEIHGAFAAALTERVLGEVAIDGAIFSEPIAGDDRALISPRMYANLALPSYAPVLAVLRRYGVDQVILRTYANPRAILAPAVAGAFSCLWAMEANPVDMDYHALR
ncbi:MAG: hypothetical protein FJ029_07970 [Actinobacteria bacterium]|nr:hypothetical protein [Actinomycetota bacterium]